MRKKLMAATVALVVFVALAGAPSTASATNDPDLTYPFGTLLKAGSTLKGTAIATTLVTTSSEGAVEECSKLSMTATLTKNNGSEFEGDIESFGLSICQTSSIGTNPEINGLPWCIRSTSTMATDAFQIRGDSCANEPRPIRITIGGCTYERAANTPIIGTYSTSSEPAQLSLKHVEFLKVSFFCISPTFLDIAFILETDTEPSNPVSIS